MKMMMVMVIALNRHMGPMQIELQTWHQPDQGDMGFD